VWATSTGATVDADRADSHGFVVSDSDISLLSFVSLHNILSPVIQAWENYKPEVEQILN
jgi:hypothetical protein